MRVASSSRRVHCAGCGLKCQGAAIRFDRRVFHATCFDKLNTSSDKQQVAPNKPTSANMKLKSNTLPPKHPRHQHEPSSKKQPSSSTNISVISNRCAGCKAPIDATHDALRALDAHWHVTCFRCSACNAPLLGEYVTARDGRAYCERDYQRLFGIVCVYCKRYISGKVLQAGDSHHFHPSCARCSKCGDPFVPGEEMFVQGEVTWHPRCGPQQAAAVASSFAADEFGSTRSSQLHRNRSPSLCSSRSRSASPFSYMTRQFGRTSPSAMYADSEAVGDLSRVYTISYLNAAESSNNGYLRRPIEPRAPKSPQFSRPTPATTSSTLAARGAMSPNYTGGGGGGVFSVLSSAASSSRPTSATRARSRPRSPSGYVDEPIVLSHYPAAQRPAPNEVPKIERDDFPGPPFAYSNGTGSGPSSKLLHNHESTSTQRGRSETRRDRQSASRSVPKSLDASNKLSNSDQDDDEDRAARERAELSKIATGIGKVFLERLEAREQLRAWKRGNLDPRNASRTPSATRELSKALRFEGRPSSPVARAGSSSIVSRQQQQQQHQYHSRANKSPLPNDNNLNTPDDSSMIMFDNEHAANSSSLAYGYKVASSSSGPRHAPRAGYGASNNSNSTNNIEPNKTSTNKQSVIQNVNGFYGDARRANQISGNLQRGAWSNRSLPNVSAAPMSPPASSASSRLINDLSTQMKPSSEPPKVYPYHLLLTSNYRLPPDVDRCHLERHLAADEFRTVLHCDRRDFYRLPDWRRNELKRRALLF